MVGIISMVAATTGIRRDALEAALLAVVVSTAVASVAVMLRELEAVVLVVGTVVAVAATDDCRPLVLGP